MAAIGHLVWILELKKRKNTAENSLMQLNGLFRSEQTDRQLHVQVIYVEVHALSQALPRQHKDATPTPSYSETCQWRTPLLPTNFVRCFEVTAIHRLFSIERASFVHGRPVRCTEMFAIYGVHYSHVSLYFASCAMRCDPNEILRY